MVGYSQRKREEEQMASCSSCGWWSFKKGCVKLGGPCHEVEVFWRSIRRLVQARSGSEKARCKLGVR